MDPMNYKKVLLPVALSLVLLGAGCSLTRTVNLPAKNANANLSITNASSTISYPGQDGKSALKLLQAGHSVDVSAEGFVNAIDGLKPGNRQFWAFYVNGQQAQVGAKEYQTKSTETVEWKLESY